MTGQASVIDGDTLEIHGTRIRLHGIDAPQSGQHCYIGGKRWRCGKVAANVLADLIERRPATCHERGRDRYGRVVAVWRVQGEDLGAWLVGNGRALAYRRQLVHQPEIHPWEADRRSESPSRRSIPWAGACGPRPGAAK
ncbi:MAG: thermonuclease family protein [Gammaproteobacteria bacterium]|nr:thermonuclease family protein [Gammaproteobacteria bacterium]